MLNRLKQLITGEEGATMVEYALLMVLLASAAISSLSSLKTSMSTKFTTVSNAISGS
jgi:pilus assembly protein Flp/PilA